MKKWWSAPAVFGFILSCTTHETGDQALQMINADTLAHDISVLASDSFQARFPFTKGEKLTVDFLTNRFKEAGVLPGNGNSYVQEVPMVKIEATADTLIKVNTSAKSFTLKAPEEYIIWTNKTAQRIDLDNDSVVFAGYGVVAPEFNWNDYAGIDVKGKIVLVMVNDPGYWVSDSTLFKGRAMTYYGRWTYKFEEAARQGAKGCLVVHRTSAAGYPFRIVQNTFNNPRMQINDEKNRKPDCDVIGWITDTAATRLLNAAGFDSSLFEKANHAGFRAVPLNIGLTTSMKIKCTYDSSRNVIGKIEGTKKPDEVIIYTAHWDHLGIGIPDEKGDSIYNGAADNASGTAGLIEMANAFNAMKAKPDRTIVFLAVTSEEQGLLGSAYYAAHPVYPVEKTVAEINIDVLNNFGTTKDVVVVGYGQSDLDDYLGEVVKKEGRHIVPEPQPETGGYFRSDHFNFARIGIPALYQGSGSDVEGKGVEYGKKMKAELLSKNYHRPSDEFNAKTWNMEAAVTELRMLFKVGRMLSVENKWPQWKASSEFKSIRDAQHVGNK